MQLTILNRLSRDNYVIDLSTVLRTKSQDPYLMIQLLQGHSDKLVLGCWFYGQEEREYVGRALETILQEMKPDASKVRSNCSHPATLIISRT